jgi:hypothetical protein
MGRDTNSADHLVLLGEMVEMASGYADQCEESLEHDEAFMVRLAYDQLFYLRKRIAKLDEKLLNLEESIRAKAKEPSRPSSRAPRHHARGDRASKNFNSSHRHVDAGQNLAGD